MNTFKIQIPFSGFYESFYDSVIDNVIEYEIDYIENATNEDYIEYDAETFSDLVYDISFENIHEKIAKAYIAEYSQEFRNKYNIDLGLSFNCIDSPRFYNFETDKLYCNIDPEVFNSVLHLVDNDEFYQIIKDRYSMRSGFTPYTHTLEAIDRIDKHFFSEDFLEILLPEDDVIEDNYSLCESLNNVVLESIYGEIAKIKEA